MTDQPSARPRPPWLPHLLEVVEQTLRPALRADRVVVQLVTEDGASATPGPRGTGDTVLRLPLPIWAGGVATVVMHRSAPAFTDAERALARDLVTLATSAVAGRLDGEVTEKATAFVEETLRVLDEMASTRVEDRLVSVGDAALSRFGCAAWWLGAVQEGLVLPWAHAARDQSTELRMQQAARAPRRLQAPAVAAALEGGSLRATNDDPVLGDYLREAGMTEIVAAGGYDVDARQWLLSLAGDAAGCGLRDVRPAFSAVVQAALGFPRGPRPRG